MAPDSRGEAGLDLPADLGRLDGRRPEDRAAVRFPGQPHHRRRLGGFGIRRDPGRRRGDRLFGAGTLSGRDGFRDPQAPEGRDPRCGQVQPARSEAVRRGQLQHRPRQCRSRGRGAPHRLQAFRRPSAQRRGRPLGLRAPDDRPGPAEADRFRWIAPASRHHAHRSRGRRRGSHPELGRLEMGAADRLDQGRSRAAQPAHQGRCRGLRPRRRASRPAQRIPPRRWPDDLGRRGRLGAAALPRRGGDRGGLRCLDPGPPRRVPERRPG